MPIDRAFFRSKEFVVSGIIALLLLGGAAAFVASDGFDTSVRHHPGCSVPTPPGPAQTADVADTGPVSQGSAVRRTITYTFNASGLDAGSLAACTDVGDIDVSPSTDGVARIVFTLTGHGTGATRAVSSSQVDAVFTSAGGALHVAASQPSRAEVGTFFESRSTALDVSIELPDAPGAWDVELDTDVGDITLGGLRASSLNAATDVGDIDGVALDLQGDADVQTDVGDIDLRAASVGSARWELATDVGDVQVHLPSSQDNGYDVDAATDVGGVRIDIGETEFRDRSDDRGASEAERARTEGYADKPVQLTIKITTDVGDIRVMTT